MHIGFRIKQAIGLTGYNVKEFCEITERSRITTTLWINARGGIIKDQSLEEFCFHLRKCSVLCTIEWLKLGTGASPRLINTEESSPAPIIKFENLKINYDQMFLLLSKLDKEGYFEYANSQFFIIAALLSKANFAHYLSTPIILFTGDEVVIGFLFDYCKKSDILIINTLDKNTRCVPVTSIQKTGAILVLMDKKINKINNF